MSKKPEPSHARVVTDPGHEPIRVVDQVSFHPVIGLDVNLTFCTFVDIPTSDEEFAPGAIVTARLRMKIDLARALIEGLTKQLAMAEAAEGTMN